MPAMPDAPPFDIENDEELTRKRMMARERRKHCVVVVHNVPVVGPEKYNKLKSRLNTRIFEKSGRVRKDENGEPCIVYPQSPEGGSLGFAFIEYVDPDQAHRAVMDLDNRVLDPKHTFWARTAGDFERLLNVPEEFVPPTPLPAATKDMPNYRSWLLDSRGRDMFLVRHEETTSIYWHDHVVKPSMVSFCV